MSKRIKILTICLVLAIVGIVYAADREQYHVFRLSLGDPATVITADNGTFSWPGSFSVTSNSTVGGIEILTPLAQNVTNAEVVTVANRVIILNGTGGADNTTNTITLNDPVTLGKLVTLIVEGTSSNLIGLADSGNLRLTGALVLDNYDAVTLYGVETGVWSQVSSAIDN